MSRLNMGNKVDGSQTHGSESERRTKKKLKAMYRFRGNKDVRYGGVYQVRVRKWITDMKKDTRSEGGC
jgi:hypothetical protein